MIVISIENISKYYRLGSIGNRTLYEDLNRWWAKLRGKPDPTLRIDQPPAPKKQPATKNESPFTFHGVFRHHESRHPGRWFRHAHQ